MQRDVWVGSEFLHLIYLSAKTLFNLTRPSAPFDPDSPYWVIKNALSLAKALDIPSEKVIEIVT